MPENTDHPTQKPEKLYAKLILASSEVGDVVFDPFMGSAKEWRLAYGKENNMLQAKDEKGIKDEIDKTDRNRAAYYNYYTQNRWGDAHNYDLAINAALGHDACVQMILAAAEAKEKAMEG